MDLVFPGILAHICVNVTLFLPPKSFVFSKIPDVFFSISYLFLNPRLCQRIRLVVTEKYIVRDWLDSDNPRCTVG